MYTPGMFKGKKITVMGLGLLGRGVGDIIFFAEEGAELIVTDLKTKEQLAYSLEQLKNFKNIEYVLGEHRLEDFRNRDLILKAASVPLDSPYIAEAKKNGIPVEMSAALFARLSPATVVGITGTRGKSTVTHLLFEILVAATKDPSTKLGAQGVKVFLGGNVRGISTLSRVHGPRQGDIMVMELDSWQLQGFGESKISPHVAVFTTFMSDHQNYYKGDMKQYLDDKANIFKFQKPEDILVIGDQVEKIILDSYKPQAKTVISHIADVPESWKLLMPGEHNKYNVAIALNAARALGVNNEIIKNTIEGFEGLVGRLQFVKEIKGVKIYNDTNSTTPDATMAALRALTVPGQSSRQNQNIILILGGADKNLDMSGLISEIPNYCKKIILLPGTGTEKIKHALTTALEVSSMTEAVQKALEHSQAGDTILLSPGFASFGLFKNEYDRGEQFIQALESLVY